MIAFTDVHYFETHARAAAVVATDWRAVEAAGVYTIEQPVPDEYQAGQFYKRELPPLLAVIADVSDPIEAVVVDGYCTLGADGEPGLGAYLHEALKQHVPIIGVAKNRFRGTTHAVEVLRGESKNPLFVTAIGMEAQEAADHIAAMAGEHRIPTLLKQVDRVARHGKA